jgi:hypothetical protein
MGRADQSGRSDASQIFSSIVDPADRASARAIVRPQLAQITNRSDSKPVRRGLQLSGLRTQCVRPNSRRPLSPVDPEARCSNTGPLSFRPRPRRGLSLRCGAVSKIQRFWATINKSAQRSAIFSASCSVASQNSGSICS